MALSSSLLVGDFREVCHPGTIPALQPTRGSGDGYISGVGIAGVGTNVASVGGAIPQSFGEGVSRMNLRFYEDPETGEPHIYRHDVDESEVEEVLARPIEDRAGREGSRVALGHTRAGRYLQVIYVPDPEPDSGFVITAYDLGPKAKQALRRRRRRKGR